MKWSIGLLAVLLAFTFADDHVENIEVMYDQPANLTCMDAEFDPTPNQQVEIMWILPNGDHVRRNLNHERVMVFEEGKVIKIEKVDDEDFGVYNCLIYRLATQDYVIIQKGINVNGPYWGDLAAKYRMNFIVGAVAAAVVFVLMIGICYFMNRSHTHDINEAKRMNDPNFWSTNGIDNTAAEFEDIEVKKKAPINGDSALPVYTTIEPTEVATKL